MGLLRWVDRISERLIYTLSSGREFVVLSFARTGSNFLIEMLNFHPNLKCHGELFAPKGIYYRGNYRWLNKRSDFWTKLRDWFPLCSLRFFQFSLLSSRVVGFKLFDEHSQWVRQFVLSREETKKILLLRRNFLRAEISLQIAKKTDAWVQFSNNQEREKIVFDVVGFWEHLGSVRKFEEEVEEFLKSTGQSYVKLFYEDINGADLGKKMMEIVRFLGLDVYEFQEKQVRLRKQNPHSIRELVTNYEEIEASLVGTECEWMLDDE